ncbi:MAG: HlyD family efflux transporter periplasmic adaptor subunit [Planctomycetales bacterium]|nr:HlyD family efflux transporter periplasmic adaptor subunit [Planctomycetales bacterium]
MSRRIAMSFRAPQPRASRRGVGRLAAVSLIALLLIAAGGSGYLWWGAESDETLVSDAILHTVSRSDFVHQITERGEILSSAVTDIRSEVKSKNSPGLAILRVVEEGIQVKAGDFLVQLDSSALEEELTTQRIAVNTSEAFVVEARNVYETALIAQKEYVEGTYLQERQTIESEIFVAEENLNRAKEYYEYSKKMASKGYVNELQLQADKFAVEKSSKELEAAQTKLRVLDEFTKAKTVKQFESDVVIAEAKWEAEKNSLALEQQKLHEIEQQIANCTIVAPRDGTVKYAHENDRRGESDFIVEEGAMVRERQTILKMPDPASMQVEITVNESLVQYVRQGMPATILPVGLEGVELRGTVASVSQYAEPSGWRKANVKEYKATVKLTDTSPQVRAGMTASVSIQCARVPAAIQVPVQSVYAHGQQFYCFVFDRNNWVAKQVECGPTNDRFFVVKKGLEESERVALNPRRFLDFVNLPDLPPEEQQRAVPQHRSEEVAVAPKQEGQEQLAKQPEAGKPKSGG